MKYFKHDLDSFNDDKIWELVEIQGMQGYGIWWWLLEQLYSAEDKEFQIHASETWFKKASKAMNLSDWRTLVRTLDTLSEVGLIDSQLWAEHHIYCPGIAKRADAYVAEKLAARERKRKQREREKANKETELSQPVTRDNCDVTGSHKTVLTRVDPDPYSDPYSDPEKKDQERPPFSGSNTPTPKTKTSVRGSYLPGLTPYQGSGQFMEERPWLKRWKNPNPEYDEGFFDVVKNYLSTTGQYEGKTVTKGNVIGYLSMVNQSKEEQVDHARLQRIYGLWIDYQDRQTKANKPKRTYQVVESEFDRILRGNIAS